MRRTSPPPPQRFAPGGRRMLDARWLAYVELTRETGNDAALRSAPLLGRGIDEFNAERFRASHETWETLWVDAAYPERLFLLGLAKLGAGFAHVPRRNPKGARRLLEDAIRFIGPFGPTYAGVAVAPLVSDVNAWLTAHRSGLAASYPKLSCTLDQTAERAPLGPGAPARWGAA